MSIAVSWLRAARNMVLPAKVYDFWCQEFGLISRRDQAMAKVVKVVQESSDSVSLWLKPNANFEGIQPGQHINIGVEVDGRRLNRSYSVSRVKGRRFRITARQVSQGKVSNYLNNYAKKGLVITLGDVYGEVSMAHFEEKPALFLAGGIGITPIISMLEAWSTSMRNHPVELMYWGKSEKDLAFIKRLKKIAKKNDWFRLHVIETEFIERNEDGTPKLIAESAQWFEDLKKRLPNVEAFACGNEGFVNQLRDRFQPWVNSFSFESFTPAFATASAGAPIQVNLTKQRRSVSIPSGMNILHGLEQAGVSIASGCRRGTCNTCTCKKVSGLVQDQQDKRVHAEDDAMFKPCMHAAISDITLEL
ncbi:iron-sulfur cluster-binding domain-containing protein [Reinekea forsetii]|nr:iron-sulfur cluster-binding domain-containing protein [Reinekea forsetii]